VLWHWCRGELVYEPPRDSPTLWEIGIPDVQLLSSMFLIQIPFTWTDFMSTIQTGIGVEDLLNVFLPKCRYKSDRTSRFNLLNWELSVCFLELRVKGVIEEQRFKSWWRRKNTDIKKSYLSFGSYNWTDLTSYLLKLPGLFFAFILTPPHENTSAMANWALSNNWLN
jgi:hypothetical protein